MRALTILLLTLFTAAPLTGQNDFLAAREIGPDGTHWVRVDSVEGARPGAFVLVYQATGAEVATEDEIGAVTALNGAGRYALHRLESVSGDSLFLRGPLAGDFQAEHTQIVLSPSTEVRAAAEGELAAPGFDGRTGGVIFLAADSLLNIAGTLTADGAGSSGGRGEEADSECTAASLVFRAVYPAGDWRGSRRGQGVAPTPDNQELGRAPLANGGGGGNDHNTGGGGGANITPGGRGGITVLDGLFSGACPGPFPGFGGLALPDSTDRLYLGGGGGAGHANNTDEATGGNGGGLIVLWAPTIEFSPSAIISAQGNDAVEIDGDGAGGGGAGGSLLIEADTLRGAPIINLVGGAGGDTQNQPRRCFGPGGGGAGGRILQREPATEDFQPTINLNGGPAGRRLRSDICAETDEPAGNGEAGTFTLLPRPAEPIVRIGFQAPDGCAPYTVMLRDSSQGPATNYFWRLPGSVEDTASTPNPTATYSLPGRFLITLELTFAGGRTLKDSTVINVRARPRAEISAVPNGLDVDFTTPTSPGVAYEWSFGDGGTSNERTPEYTYSEAGTYEVSLTTSSGPCISRDTLSVTVDVLDDVRELAELGVRVYPNPTQDVIRVDGRARIIGIRDYNGRQLATPAGTNVSLDNFPPGVYLLDISVDGRVLQARVVKQ